MHFSLPLLIYALSLTVPDRFMLVGCAIKTTFMQETTASHAKLNLMMLNGSGLK